MYPIDLQGKTGVVFGVANHRSIAWSIAQVLHQAGARLAFAYQNERVRAGVARLAEPLPGRCSSSATSLTTTTWPAPTRR